MKQYNKGQSLIELLVSLGIFVIIVSGLAFLIIDSYTASRLGEEITKATFLAEEGMEATISIRDNNWQDLTDGTHGLAISENHWVFHNTQEDISQQLRQGVRKIIIQSISPDIKKVTSLVSWQFTKIRPKQIKLVTYLTNWQQISPAFTQNDFRWYENIDNLTPTTALTSENEEIFNVTSSDILRIRMNILVQGADVPASSQSFKLQYASTTEICTSSLNWFDVGDAASLEIWRGYDNPTSSDGALLPSFLLASSTLAQSYEETNNSVNNPQAITVGEQAEWDWVIQNNQAPQNTTYCFRMIHSTGIPLDTYNVDGYPKLTTGAPSAPYCTGEPLSCDQFVDQSTCQSQDGCSWSAAYCGGTCTPCSELADKKLCGNQKGCRWDRKSKTCTGICNSCETINSQQVCQNQLGCSWNPAVCQGTAQACDTYTTQQDCESQQGCQWLIP